MRHEFKPESRKWEKREDFSKDIRLHALVRLKTSGGNVMWQGKVARLNDTLDEQTRTVGLILLVDQPYANAVPGERSLLVKGMFVEVWLRARPLKSKLVVPVGALHDGHIFIVGKDNRLEKRRVKTGYGGDGFVVVHDGVEAGARVVVSDLITALPGMLLKPVHDAGLQAQLTKMVRGPVDS